MAAVRDILRHIAIEIGDKRRKCHRKRSHSIPAGQCHLAVYDGPRRARKNYCSICAKEILDLASKQFGEIRFQLFGQELPQEQEINL